MEGCEKQKYQDRAKRKDTDFGRFIKCMEGNSEKTFQQHKDQLIVRRRLKENWLNRSKIIPPSFPEYRQIDYSHYSRARGILKKPTSYKNIKQTHGFAQQDDKVINNHLLGKDEFISKNSKLNQDMGSIASSDKIRSNWKLQLRKDELNFLYFAIGEENTEIKKDTVKNFWTTIEKSFKVRKIHRKLKEGRSEVTKILKNSLEKSRESKNHCVTDSDESLFRLKYRG